MTRIRNCLTKFYLQKIRRLILPRDLIQYAAKKHAAKIAAVDGEREITYGRLYERAKKFANTLIGLGIYKDGKLAVLLYNCQEYFEIRIAAYLTGIVLVPIIWDMEPKDIISILNGCDVKALIYDPEISMDISTIKEKTHVKHFIEIVSYEELLQKSIPIDPKVKISADDLASINFSSGTTGRPKGIMLTHGNWTASFYNYLLNSPRAQRSHPTILHTLSSSTAGGTGFLPMFFIGAKNILLKKFDPQQTLSLILKREINSFFTSSSLFIQLLDYCKQETINTSSLSLFGIVVGTEQLPQAKFKEAIEFFGPIIQRGYGMAEALPPLTLLRSKDYLLKGPVRGDILDEAKLLSVGRPLKGVRIKIVDGRIAVQSAAVSAGYWNNPELTREHYKDGWFHTNDFGYFDQDGYLYVLGRKEDILMRDNNGLIFAGQLEEALHRHPAVLQACAFRTGESKIVACVSLKQGSKNITSDELVKFCADKLPKSALPDTVVILHELPLRATGKLDKTRIKEASLKSASEREPI